MVAVPADLMRSVLRPAPALTSWLVAGSWPRGAIASAICVSARARRKGSGTEGLAGLDARHGELGANGDLLQHARDLKVAAARQVRAVDGLDVVAHSHVLDLGLQRVSGVADGAARQP